MGILLLEGGAEFGGLMSRPDLEAIRLAGGLDIQIAILPTAAAPDRNDERAGRNGVRWFRSLGASRVEVVPAIDRSSAGSADYAQRLGSANLIYLLGGFPRHLCETLQDSLVWNSALGAFKGGAVIGGSSAGAMVLCENYYDPYTKELLPGLGLLKGACVLPHHENSGRRWAADLARKLPSSTLIGIDEQTGAVDDPSGRWTVYGRGSVTLYRSGQRPRVYAPGESFTLAKAQG